MSDLTPSLSIPRWGVMWGLAIFIYAISKGLSWTQRSSSSAPVWKHVIYLVVWPGMDVDPFLSVCNVSHPTLADWIFATFKLGCGMSILLLVVPALAGANRYLVGWIGMLGIVFALHFGLFHLISNLCRQLGLNAVPIMNWPIASQSLTGFWGKRWNLAFRDLTYHFLFRPLVRYIGPAGTLMAGFLVSGLVHDLVISIPAGGGYGLPTCYFLIQGTAIFAERSQWGRAIGLGQGVRGWLFCLVSVLAPCPLLFHKSFVCGVIVPFLQVIGLVK